MVFGSRNTIWLAIGAVILDLVAYVLLGYDQVFKAIQIPILGIAVTATIAWFPAAIGAIRRKVKTAADKVAVAIWMTWGVLTLQRIYAFAVAFLTVGTERPEWLVYSPISSVVGVLIIVAGIYAAFATVFGTDVPKPDKTWTLISTAAGAFAAGALATYALTIGLKG